MFWLVWQALKDGFATECAVVTHHRLEKGPDGTLVPAGKLEEPLIVDLRNVYDPESMANAGFRYVSVGRRTIEATS